MQGTYLSLSLCRRTEVLDGVERPFTHELQCNCHVGLFLIVSLSIPCPLRSAVPSRIVSRRLSRLNNEVALRCGATCDGMREFQRVKAGPSLKEVKEMTNKPENAGRTRRALLRAASGTAVASFGLAGLAGTAAACGDDPTDCPCCANGRKVKIAHRPEGHEGEKCIDLCLPPSAAQAHLDKHEYDTCGPCDDK